MKLRRQFNLVLFCLLLSINTLVLAQSTVKQEIMGELYVLPLRFQGANFLYNEWGSGAIRFTNGKLVDGIVVKYDILTDQVVYYNEAIKRMFSVDKEFIDSVFITSPEGSLLAFVPYSGEAELFHLKQNQMLYVAYPGKIRLYARFVMLVESAREIGAKDELYRRDYFFIEHNGSMNEFTIRRKNIIALFPGKKKEVKRLLIRYPVKRKNLNDMVRFLTEIEKVEH